MRDGGTRLRELITTRADLGRWDTVLSRYAELQLLRAFALARPLGIVCRALTWHVVVAHMDADVREGYADVVPDSLRRFLAAEAEGR